MFGKNAFGFTGGHFHRSWIQPDYRKMILNAMVWSAGLDVPEDGVESVDPVILKNKSLLHAIAKGDPPVRIFKIANDLFIKPKSVLRFDIFLIVVVTGWIESLRPFTGDNVHMGNQAVSKKLTRPKA